LCITNVQFEKDDIFNLKYPDEYFDHILVKADFTECIVSPKMVYVNNSKPELIESFTKKTFTAMIEGTKEKAIQDSVIDSTTIEKGFNDLQRTCAPDGVF
jgi:hypothetical protein